MNSGHDLAGPMKILSRPEWAEAFEDILTRHVAPDGGNLVENYLKRRGWMEGTQARRYMTARRAFNDASQQ